MDVRLWRMSHTQSGRTSWLLLPTVNVEVFFLALATFAQEVGAGPDKHIVLVLDRAGWHSSSRLTLPEGIHLMFLPPYSPEVQQASRLWPLSGRATGQSGLHLSR
jgi:DDE superfamily endonuclease